MFPLPRLAPVGPVQLYSMPHCVCVWPERPLCDCAYRHTIGIMEILAVGCGAGVLGFMLGTSAGRSTKSGDSSAPPFKQSVLNMGVDAAHLGLLGIGEEVGYFKALFEGPASSSELAKRAGCDPRYTKEWCLHMASRGVLMYDPTSAAFTLQPHLVEDLKDPNTLGMSYGIPAVLAKRNEHVTAYKTGSGISWNSYDSGLNVCACRFFKPLYENMLVPTLPSEIRKLRDTWEYFFCSN